MGRTVARSKEVSLKCSLEKENGGDSFGDSENRNQIMAFQEV